MGVNLREVELLVQKRERLQEVFLDLLARNILRSADRKDESFLNSETYVKKRIPAWVPVRSSHGTVVVERLASNTNQTRVNACTLDPVLV